VAEVPWPQDDPYYMTPEEEARVELRAALDRITLLESQLEDAQLKIADLEGDLRMVRSGRDTFRRLLDALQSKIANRRRGHPKRRAQPQEPAQ